MADTVEKLRITMIRKFKGILEKRTFAELFEIVDRVGSYGSAWWLDDTPAI